MNANQNVNMLTNNESSVTSISVLKYGMGVIQTAVVTQTRKKYFKKKNCTSDGHNK